jgi:hypothetical protein
LFLNFICLIFDVIQAQWRASALEGAVALEGVVVAAADLEAADRADVVAALLGVALAKKKKRYCFKCLFKVLFMFIELCFIFFI